MADKKISQLTAVSTPLAGTEVLPIVQSGATKKVTALELTGTTVDSAGNVTIANGNFVIGTSGKGIDFSATPGAGTSELFSDYEEGAWTPVPKDSLGNQPISFFVLLGKYTKIGNICIATCSISIQNPGAFTAFSTVEGLPFAVFNTGNNFLKFAGSHWTNTTTNVGTNGVYAFENTSKIQVDGTTGGGAGQQLNVTVTYQTA